MEVIRPKVTIVDRFDPEAIIKKLELSARKCWQSEPKDQPASVFLRNIIKRGHTSVLEHVSLTFDIICDRGVSHELVRHRIASYSQESTRYVKYNNNMQFIEPIDLYQNELLYDIWYNECEHSEDTYRKMMELGAKAQEARSILNNSLKTEVRMTINIRSLRNFFDLRCDKAAHPHMKEIAIPMLLTMKTYLPGLFDDIGYDEEFFKNYLDTNDYDYNKTVKFEHMPSNYYAK